MTCTSSRVLALVVCLYVPASTPRNRRWEEVQGNFPLTCVATLCAAASSGRGPRTVFSRNPQSRLQPCHNGHTHQSFDTVKCHCARCTLQHRLVRRLLPDFSKRWVFASFGLCVAPSPVPRTACSRSASHPTAFFPTFRHNTLSQTCRRAPPPPPSASTAS